MSASQPQGHRSGEGTAGLWNHIREDDQRKEGDPGDLQDDAGHRHAGEGQQQQQPQQRGWRS